MREVTVQFSDEEFKALERTVREHPEKHASIEELLKARARQIKEAQEHNDRVDWGRKHPEYYYRWINKRGVEHRFYFRKVKEVYGPDAGKFAWRVEKVRGGGDFFPHLKLVERGTSSTRKALEKAADVRRKRYDTKGAA